MTPLAGTGTPRSRTSARAVGRDDDASGQLARAADPPTQQCPITRRVTTDTDTRPLAMEETRRSAEDTQLSYPQTPTTD